MKKTNHILAIAAGTLIASYSYGQEDQDDSLESEQNSAETDEYQYQPPKKSLSQKYKERKRRGGYIFSPGIYRANDKSANGYEFSFLYNGYGPVIGFEEKFKYAEIEYASLLLTLGVGVRKIDDQVERKKKGDATQVTVSFPIFPLFPYARWIFDDPEKDKEFGLMLKIPVSWSAKGQHDDWED